MSKRSFLAQPSVSETHEVYSVSDYSKANAIFIEDKTNARTFSTADELAYELETNDRSYHFRVHANKQYIFFGDIDHFDKDIDIFAKYLSDFLEKYYKLSLKPYEIAYTQNTRNKDSYHYSVPKWNASTEKLKEVHSNFLEIYKDELTKNLNGTTVRCVDTTVYSEHWFRCPNQSKGKGKYVKDTTREQCDNVHKIIRGNMIDFIIDHIPKDSVNINDVRNINKNAKTKMALVKKRSNESEIVPFVNHGQRDDGLILTRTTLYKEIFDECYKQYRFEVYEYWIKVGMALKNTFEDQEEAFKLFDYYSSKGNNYQGTEATEVKFKTFIRREEGLTIGTIYFYAMEDNKPKFIEIMNKNTFELEQSDICKYIKAIAGFKFIYKKIGTNYVLYCFNGKYWQNDDILLRSFISNELYEFLKTILTQVYWDSKNFPKMKTQLNKLKCIKFKKELIESYKENGYSPDVEFDCKWNLLGFRNVVYDLESESFREYQYDDYIATTTGYDWREPTEEELMTLNELIKKIMPVEDERELYLQVLCTTLEGRALERYVIFNGGGGNGKGLINDLLIMALGNHALLGNNSILFETARTGSNPEKANIHKKRLVVFREPPAKNRFQNSVIKELTGGGKFSARGHHEHETEKELHLTTIVECNARPLFAEEPKDSEIRRIIDIYFRSTFTDDVERLDDSNHIYKANQYYKTFEFQQSHKYALIKILMEQHKKYKKNGYVLKLPESISNRTMLYLEMSCNIVQWFKDHYQYTEDKNCTIKVKDLYDNFVNSEYFSNLSKADKRKYNKSFFIDYVRTNIFFRKYYCERTSNMKNFIRHWTEILEEEEKVPMI